MTLHHTDAAFVESVEAQTPLRVGSRLGARMPASCVSGGKILLAALSDEELLARYPDEALEILTPRSIRTRTELLAELNWTGGELVSDLRTSIRYFRTTRDGRIAFGGGD